MKKRNYKKEAEELQERIKKLEIEKETLMNVIRDLQYKPFYYGHYQSYTHTTIPTIQQENIDITPTIYCSH